MSTSIVGTSSRNEALASDAYSLESALFRERPDLWAVAKLATHCKDERYSSLIAHAFDILSAAEGEQVTLIL